MNNKTLFFWNITIVISLLFTFILAFQNFKSHEQVTKLWKTYINQEIGTDKVLQQKIEVLENNLVDRENFKFIIEDPPTELSNVIVFDGYDPRFSGSSKYIFVTAIITSSKDKHFAIVRHRDQEFTVAEGDSIAGGYISLITEMEVIFNKNEKKYKFYNGLDTTLIE